MTELAIPTEVQNDLERWADEARQVHQIARSLADTSFVPRNMQGRPDEVTGAILAGRELGLAPMASLRAIDIIDGTPAIRAHALRGIVQSRGHKVWVEESTETRAVVCGHRAGESGTRQRSVWTMERARKANLLGKKNWANHQQAMLVARATAELCRMIASDAIVGMPYVSEEIEDEAGGAEAAPTKAPARRVMERAKAPEPQLNPPEVGPGHVPAAAHAVGPEEPAATPTERAPDPWLATSGPQAITTQTRVRLMAELNNKGYRDRVARLSKCSQLVGREVTSGNQLTESEAVQIIAALNEYPAYEGAAGDDPSS